MSEVVALTIGVALGLAMCFCLIWRARGSFPFDGSTKDPYADWVREVSINTPGFEPPYIMGGNGHYISNPRWRPHQTIRHTDGTETCTRQK